MILFDVFVVFLCAEVVYLDPIHENRIRKNFENRGNAWLSDFLGKARKCNKQLAWLGDEKWR